jgi:hypothetical protein
MVSDADMIEWIDRHDCAELILKPDAAGESEDRFYFGALMGDFGSAVSLREVLADRVRAGRTVPQGERLRPAAGKSEVAG